MKTWKNRNRRSKKHKQRGGVKYDVEELKPKVEALLQLPRFLNTVGSANPADAEFGALLKRLQYKLSKATEKSIDVNQTEIDKFNDEFRKLPPAAPAPAAPAPPPAPAPAPAPPPGQAVYPFKAPAAGEGQPKTIADCTQMLAEAKAHIAALEGNLAEETARMKAANEAFQAQLAALDRNIKAKKAELDAATAAAAALSGDKDKIEAELDRIKQELEAKLGELAGMSGLNVRLNKTVEELRTAAGNKDAQISALERLRGELEGFKASSMGDIAARDKEIKNLKTDHEKELADTNRRYQDEAAKLRADLDRIQTEGGKLTTDQQKEIESLNAQLRVLNARIEELRGQLTTSRAATEKEAEDKRKAADEATQLATVEAEKLKAATAQGAELNEKLKAAQAANAAADRAASEAKAAQQVSAEAAAAANRKVTEAEEAARRAQAAAAEAVASKEASDGEKKQAQDAAAAAETARAAAAAEAQARTTEAEQARQAAAVAEAGRAEIQASLDALKESVPKIISITGEDNVVVGGVGGRQARYGEPLKVNWTKGAADRDTWVFVMFATVGGNVVPVYSQLVLNDQSFTFTSTVDGDVQAVVYDVVSHSRGAIGF